MTTRRWKLRLRSGGSMLVEYDARQVRLHPPVVLTTGMQASRAPIIIDAADFYDLAASFLGEVQYTEAEGDITDGDARSGPLHRAIDATSR